MNSRFCWRVPEVVQTSAMDCGPAALKCVLEGVGVRVSYGRLREACQTDVDGTSIDMLEELAVELGLDAEQIVIPTDHVLLREAGALPAIAVIRLPNGFAHFLVVWAVRGPWVEIMDPAIGRRWIRRRTLLNMLFLHTMPVAVEDWRAWAKTDDFCVPLRARIVGLGFSSSQAKPLLESARSQPGWRPLAALDASTRMLSELVEAGGMRRREAAAVLAPMAERAREQPLTEPVVPWSFWMVQPLAAEAGADAEHLADERDADPTVQLRGAALIRMGLPTKCRRPGRAESVPSDSDSVRAHPPLSPELQAALTEPSPHPLRELWHMLHGNGLIRPMLILGAAIVAAAGVTFEALLFRGLLDLGQELSVGTQRLAGMGVLLAFLIGLTALQLCLDAGLLQMGRHLEARIRMAFLGKIPHLQDRYFRSRLSSDMADRCHALPLLRQLPKLAIGGLLRPTFALVFTTIGIGLLDPSSAFLATFVALVSITLPMLLQPFLSERDLRMRTHSGGLMRFYLDALLGLVAVRAHGAEPAVRREHEGLLVEWFRTASSYHRATVVIQGIVALSGFGLGAWLLFRYLSSVEEAGAALLMVYWTLQLPVLGDQIARAARQYPSHRNVVLRLLEPLGAPEKIASFQNDATGRPPYRRLQPQLAQGLRNVGHATKTSPGVAISMAGVHVRAAGHPILSGVDLDIDSGEHVAVVGQSGAGKSSLVGLLLGWHRPVSGDVRVDGRVLDELGLEGLRECTAWVDPEVMLWNHTLFANVSYGTKGRTDRDFFVATGRADLRPVLEHLPYGLQTRLGESGRFVSGGEGQRIRLARGMLRPNVRLTILDEAFRGLDRPRRAALLSRAREHWRRSTLLCVTHDVQQTLAFPRVLVVEHGRIVEDGDPRDLVQHAGSRYKALFEAEESLRVRTWCDDRWRRLWLEDGRLREVQPEEEAKAP